MKPNTLLRCLTIVLMPLFLASCALPGFLSFKGTRLGWNQVELSAAPGANQNSPVAIDIVLVRDESMIDRLNELTAAKWFGARADLLKTYPAALSYRSWEVVPGQALRVPGASFGSTRVVAVFVFANYTAPGAHRLRVEELKNPIIVRLEAQSFDVTLAQ